MDQNIEKILNLLNEISYGWVDKEGNIHTKAKRSIFINNYHLQSIDETLGYKVGTCWEMTELARFYLEKEDIPMDSYFVMYDDPNIIARHTIAVAKQYGKYYWMEKAWKNIGKFKEYDSSDEILATVVEMFARMYRIVDFDYKKILIYKYSKPMTGLTFDDFTDYCMNQDEVILDGYYIKKLKKFVLDSRYGLHINDIEKHDEYTVVASHYVKDYRLNYISDIVENEAFINIEEKVDKEMMFRAANPCYIVYSDTALYNKKDTAFESSKYLPGDEYTWMTLSNFSKVSNIDASTNYEVEISQTTDMEIIADVFERSHLDFDEVDFDGYYKMYENYTGPQNKDFTHLFYLVKLDLDLAGALMVSYNDKIAGIYDFELMKPYRDKDVKKVILKRMINKLKSMNKRVIFIDAKKNSELEQICGELGFEKAISTQFFVKKENKKERSIWH